MFLVTGVIFLGIATPSEAAATGAIGTFILAAFYRKLNWEVIKNSIASAFETTVMLFMIFAGATAFAQILAFSGATRGLIEFTTTLPLAPILVVAAMQVIILIMGAFMDVVAIMMITLPMFVPVVTVLGFNPVWFAVIIILNLEIAVTSPPFGSNLFTMKAVAPPDITIVDIYKATLPFIGLDLIAMVLLLAFPTIALWLPALMQ